MPKLLYTALTGPNRDLEIVNTKSIPDMKPRRKSA